MDNALLSTSAYFRLGQASSIFGFDVISENKGMTSDMFENLYILSMSMTDLFGQCLIEHKCILSTRTSLFYI